MTRDEMRVLLFSALSEGADINRLLQIAGRAVFDNPIMLTNSAFRTLALFTDVEMPDDVVWREAESMGAFSRETIEAFRSDLASSKLFVERRSFIYATGLGKDLPRILAPVGSEAETMGYLIIFAVRHPFREDEPELAEVLCEALRILLRQPALHDSGMNLVDYTLKQLLGGKKPNRESIANAVTRKTFLAGCISMPDDQKKKQYIPYLQEAFTGSNPFNHCFIYQDSIFFLENYDTDSEHRRTQAALQRLLPQYGLTAGISNPFTDITDLPIYYRQAKDAKAAGPLFLPGQHVYEFRKMQVSVMLRRFTREEKAAMITPEYQALRQYDEEHHTDLTATVVTWYRTSLNITDTAVALHVHRNTVAYRLDLVREKLGIPIDRMEVLTYIVVSDLIRKG